MNNERYSITPIDDNTEWVDGSFSNNVAPFPVRKWREPLPIGVEGRSVTPQEEAEAPSREKDVARFYPPLLLLSTGLTAVFFFLYLTKPVITSEPPSSVAAAEQVETSTAIVPTPVEELVPWPTQEKAGSSAQNVGAVATKLFPDQLPTSGESGARPSLDVIDVPFFDPVSAVDFNAEAAREAEQIRESLRLNRAQASILRKKSIALELQWDSLLRSAEGEATAEAPTSK